MPQFLFIFPRSFTLLNRGAYSLKTRFLTNRVISDIRVRAIKKENNIEIDRLEALYTRYIKSEFGVEDDL